MPLNSLQLPDGSNIGINEGQTAGKTDMPCIYELKIEGISHDL